MSRYVNRRWSIELDGEPFIAATSGRQFKATFEILYDFGGFTSYADIAIYNLNTDTANKAFKTGTSITFRAGYEDSIDNIFTGTIKNVLRERQGPNTITRLICRGGKLTEDQAQINETLGKNSRITDIIRACIAAMGYPAVMEDAQFDNVDPYPSGFTMGGDPRVILDSLAAAHGFSYVIENGRIVVVRDGAFRQGDIHVVSQFTGMEGIPEITELGVDVTVRLQPKIKIGGRVSIESDLATFNFSNLYFVDIPESAGQGVYRIFRIAHTGDTWGDAWSTKVTGYR